MTVGVYLGALAQRVIDCGSFAATLRPGNPRFLVVAGDPLRGGVPIGDFQAFEQAMVFAEAEALERGCECIDHTLDEAGA